MKLINIILLLMWLAVLIVSFIAFQSEGMVAGDVFKADLLGNDWHTQFSTDFIGHLLLMALWVAWRNAFSALGVVLAIFCILAGGLFSFMYILILFIQNNGNVTRVLLGKR